MKTLTYSLISLGLLVTSGLADKKKPIEAELISTTISKPLPKGIPFREQPMGYKEGASLTFFFQGENFVEFDKQSFQADGWDRYFRSHVSRSGKSASITIYNKKFNGIPEELEVDSSIQILIGSETKTKKLVLKKDAEPVEFPVFTVELYIADKKERFHRNSGVKVVGDHNSIKSIVIIRDGKELTSNGYSSSSKQKTFSFRDIKDGDEVKMVYYTKLASRTVKLFK